MRELVQIFREKNNPITLKTKIIITCVFNSGDISGIICNLKVNYKEDFACSLSHLIFDKTCKLYKEINHYQVKRAK
jgi:hypothetical protein